MNDDFITLQGVLDAVWSRLEAGPHDPDAPARHSVLATAGLEGGAEVRILVLRGANRESGTLQFNTHAASAKISELQEEPRASLLIWDPKARFQVRLACVVTIENGTNAGWSAMRADELKLYGRDPLPGHMMADPELAQPTPDPGLFKRLSARIEQIDALHLGRDLHRRAVYTRQNGFTGGWIAP